MSKFYELEDGNFGAYLLLGTARDRHGNERSFLGTAPFALADAPVQLETVTDGPLLEYSTTAYGAPVATERLAGVISKVAPGSVRAVPAEVRGYEGLVVLNVLKEVSCVDEERCEWTKWTAEDGRPELVGQYRMVSGLRIRSQAVPAGAHIFRVAGWPVALLVSRRLRGAMEAAGCLGAAFIEV